MNDSLSMIVPVRDAEGTLVAQIHHLLDLLPDLTCRFEILVVDDGSSDHTVDLARDLAREYPQVKLLRHAVPLGRSAAIRTALNVASGGTILVQEDAGPVRAADLRRLWSLRVDAQSASPPPPRMGRRGEALQPHPSTEEESLCCGNLRLLRRDPGLEGPTLAGAGWEHRLPLPDEECDAAGGRTETVASPTRTFREHLRRLLAESPAEEPATLDNVARPQ